MPASSLVDQVSSSANSPTSRSLHRSGKEVHNHRIEHSVYGMIQNGPPAASLNIGPTQHYSSIPSKPQCIHLGRKTPLKLPRCGKYPANSHFFRTPRSLLGDKLTELSNPNPIKKKLSAQNESVAESLYL